MVLVRANQPVRRLPGLLWHTLFHVHVYVHMACVQF